MIPRIEALEANLLSLVKITEQHTASLEHVKTILEQNAVSLAELNAWMERFDDRLNTLEGMVIP